MNCQDFRHECLAEGGARSDAARDHLGGCAECQAFAADFAGFEALLQQAVSLPVTADLQARLRAARPQRADRPRRLALAASLLVAVAGGLLMLNVERLSPPAGGLPQELVAHALDPHARPAPQPLPMQRVAGFMAAYGVTPQVAMPVHFAARCLVGDRYGAHLVLDLPQGAVTAIILPGERPAERASYRIERRHVIVLPTPAGSLGLVGTSQRAVSAAERLLTRRARWEV